MREGESKGSMITILLAVASSTVAARQAAQGVRHLPLAPASIAPVLPISLERFFNEVYDRSMLRLNHSETNMPPLWTLSDLERDLGNMAASGNLDSSIAIHGKSKKDLPPMPKNGTAEVMAQYINDALALNVSFVLKFEYVSPDRRPLKWISDALFNLTGIPASLHLYISAAAAQVLNPHTDPYDVLVHQLKGTKRWRACVPREEIASSSYSAGASLTDAQRCLLQELARDSIEGCTQYSVNDTHSLLCDDFTMGAGDFLYMPKGVVHFALTDVDETVFHLTIGLHRANMQWRDILRDLISQDEGATAASERVVHADLMDLYSEMGEGVHLHEAVPGWLLACRRPWQLVDGAPRANSHQIDCAKLDAELVRIFEHHLGRYGAWLYRTALEGPWRLALSVAEREKRAGEAADMEGVAPLFWWSADLAFLSRLHRDHVGLFNAFNRIAQVTDYADTTRPRWPARKKGGQREVRLIGEQSRGAPTLCDELTGWHTECRGSEPAECEAFVAKRTSCADFCESNDAWCVAAWDDDGKGCTKQETARSSGCAIPRTDQICRCRRDCVDTGPWECREEGCPARIVGCEILATACNAKFNEIWRKPPHGLGPLQVRQACPMMCKMCECKREPPGSLFT